MGGRGGNRIFVGGIGWNTTERTLKDAFDRYGKILDCLVITDKNTGRPRGFAFITFADRRSAEDALRDMHGRELDGRVISVNRADPKIATEEPDQGYGGTRGSGRENYRTEPRSDECFKCGRTGHWARDCPASGTNRRYVEEDRYDDHFHGTRFSDRDRLDSRDRYGVRDRHETDRYAPIDDRYDSGYGRERSHERYRDVRGGGERTYVSGGPTRYEHRERPGPYDHPRRSSRVSGFDRY